MSNIMWTLPLILSLLSLLLCHHHTCARQLQASLEWTSAGYLADQDLHNSKMDNMENINECDKLLHDKHQKLTAIQFRVGRLMPNPADPIQKSEKAESLRNKLMQATLGGSVSRWEMGLELTNGVLEENMQIMDVMVPMWEEMLVLRKDMMEFINEKTWKTVREKVPVHWTTDEKKERNPLILDRVIMSEMEEEHLRRLRKTVSDKMVEIGGHAREEEEKRIDLILCGVILSQIDEEEVARLRRKVTYLWVERVTMQVEDTSRSCQALLEKMNDQKMKAIQVERELDESQKKKQKMENLDLKSELDESPKHKQKMENLKNKERLQLRLQSYVESYSNHKVQAALKRIQEAVAKMEALVDKTPGDLSDQETQVVVKGVSKNVESFVKYMERLKKEVGEGGS